MKDFFVKPMVTSLSLLAAGIAIGFQVANHHASNQPQEKTHVTSPKPAYLIGATTITNTEKLPEYRAIAEPLAHKLGGYRVLASGFTEKSAELLEGEWPASGLFFIERYDSMEGLKTFITSPEFQEAKKLRNQVANTHFMIALESGDNVDTNEH